MSVVRSIAWTGNLNGIIEMVVLVLNCWKASRAGLLDGLIPLLLGEEIMLW